jgi:hypothetical protein
MADPKLEEIEAFRNFANTDAGTAVLWLRRYVDVESAIGAWFDNNQILPPADSAAIRASCPRLPDVPCTLTDGAPGLG